MAEHRFLAGLDDLVAHVAASGAPSQQLEDGTLVVVIGMAPGVDGAAALRWAPRPRLFECVTPLPIPVRPDARLAVATAIWAANKTLSSSAFVLAEGGIFHVANALLNEDGILSSKVVDLSIASTRVACDRHFPALLLAATG